MSSTTVSGVSGVATRGVKRAFNFNAGPAALPLAVLERIREELLDYQGTGMSVMEMSHRSPEFEAINDEGRAGPAAAAAAFRRITRCCSCRAAASVQFAMVPMNLYLPGKPVDVLHTGAWTAKAIEELKKLADVPAGGVRRKRTNSRACRGRMRSRSRRMPPTSTYARTTRSRARNGARCRRHGAVPLVADMSSDIASRPDRREAVRADFRRARRRTWGPRA